MFAHNEALKRIVVGGLGAALFGATCLLGAVGPVKAEPTASIHLSQPALSPQI